MSPRIIGPSGVELDVDREMARGLVRDGFAKLADGESESNLKRPDPSNILNPEGSPAVVYPVGNSVSDVVPKQADPEAGENGQPRGNASREEWATYALANGKTEDDLHGLKQGEIRALFAVSEVKSTDDGSPQAATSTDENDKTPATAEQGSKPDEK
jgi:hypothetical protein